MRKEFLLMEFKMNLPVSVEKKRVLSALVGVMERYHKSFAEYGPENYVEEEWEIYRCNFKFKIHLFEGSGKILINSQEVRVLFFTNEKFYWEKEIREDFKKHLKKYIDSAIRQAKYKIFHE
jgi:hypothetical protein